MFIEAPSLPSWLADAIPFRRRIATLPDRRAMHFIDQGEGTPVIMIHGNPTWSFLWRKVIARLHGTRSIAPDLIGFGLSDKPTDVEVHTLRQHIDWICTLVDGLELHDFVLVGSDWGGPIAAGVAMNYPGRVRGLVFGNTAVLRPNRPFRPKLFHRFSHVPVVSDVVFQKLGFPLGLLAWAQHDRKSIGKFEEKAYRFPFQTSESRVGPLALARMVANSESHPSTAVLDQIGDALVRFEGPIHLVWGKNDPILGRTLSRHRRALPRAAVTETAAGHFLQEEIPDEFAASIRAVL